MVATPINKEVTVGKKGLSYFIEDNFNSDWLDHWLTFIPEALSTDPKVFLLEFLPGITFNVLFFFVFFPKLGIFAALLLSLLSFWAGARIDKVYDNLVKGVNLEKLKKTETAKYYYVIAILILRASIYTLLIFTFSVLVSMVL